MSVYGKDYIHAHGYKVVFSVHLTYHHGNMVSSHMVGSTASAEELAEMIYNARIVYCKELNSGHCLQVDIQDYISPEEEEEAWFHGHDDH